MKKFGFLLFLLAIAVMLGGSALAQDNSVYFTTYFSNANTANAPDATLRMINDGDTGSTLYADIYVFDDSEELTECCSCYVTPDGLLAESVNGSLTHNPITHIKPTRGVIKVISSSTPLAGSLTGTAVTPTPGLRGWATHVQQTVSSYALTETLLEDSNLTGDELYALQRLCYFDALLSGLPCSCTLEDQAF